MSAAKQGDAVKIHYTGTLEDGTVFDSTQGYAPFALTLGAGGVIPGFEAAVTGMCLGDTKTVTIPPEQAYGPYDDSMTQVVPRDAIPAEIALQEGMILSAESPDGIPISFVVRAFDAESVTIDGNHPLAGHALTFALELVAIG